MDKGRELGNEMVAKGPSLEVQEAGQWVEAEVLDTDRRDTSLAEVDLAAAVVVACSAEDPIVCLWAGQAVIPSSSS